jgi:glycosyltransferase involved in cell wall biosynthesis
MPSGRLLCLTSNFPRWSGDATTPFVLHLAQDLQTLGWQVTVAAPHAPGAKRDEVLDGVRVRRFRYLLPERLESVCYQGGALINLRKNPANYLKLPFLVFAEWLHTLLWLRQERFDLLHSHWLLPQGFVGTLTAGPLKIPHVCTVHGGDVFGLQGRILRKFKAFAIRHSDAVTVNSSATRQAVLALSPDCHALHTIPMGVAPWAETPSLRAQAEALRSRFRWGQGPLLLFVGRLVEEKGVADLLAAVAMVGKTHPDLTLLIVGEGQERPILEEQARSQGLSGQVNFLGWVKPQEVPAYLAAADIFVAPSRTAPDGWVEAQGLTIIEAMMAGLPVVATRSGGIGDSVEHEVSGLLVNERSPHELAFAIERLLLDPALAQQLGQRAHGEAEKRFSRAASAAGFSRLFQSLLARGPGGEDP